MIPCSDAVRHMIGIEGHLLGNIVTTNAPIKPIDSWSSEIRRRLLVESNFESLPQSVLLEMEVISSIMKQETD
ncbi:unnamed protein product [Protopolystoma xenopodis]|uniref:Uncharacterized protein n=1 Tax=Protopolystoma xenopodis TaxID=117903 RepID=A0A3S5CSS9_9PLAT|nr:unnamed protein product [Protopolystoma xenopodis]